MNDADSRPTLGKRLREKLPEILIEAASVVFALLLALAINEWHDRQQENERAAIARAAIKAEMRQNREDLARARNRLKEIIPSLQQVVDADQPPAQRLHVNLNVSLLSEAAWRAALATQASQRIDFDWITRVAKVYELQDNFLRMQNVTVDQLSSVPSDNSVNGKQVAAALLPRLDTLNQLAEGLDQAYADTLDEMAP